MSGRARLGAVVAVAAVMSTVGAAEPTAADSHGVPNLGLELDPSEGPVGTEITVQVDIARECVTEPADWVGRFINPTVPTTYQEALQDRAKKALQERAVKQGDQNQNKNEGEAENQGEAENEGQNEGEAENEGQNEGEAENEGQNEGVEAFRDTFHKVAEAAGEDPALFTLGVAGIHAANLATQLETDPERVEAAVSSWFVIAFVDGGEAIEPVVGFDRKSGVGTIEVPELDPGQHPVIASCAALSVDVTKEAMDKAIDKALDAGTELVEANRDDFPTPLPTVPDSDEYAEAAGEVLPVFLQELLDPQAFGVEQFTVPGGDPPPTSTSTTLTTRPSPPNGEPPPKAPPAEPVPADPNFVG